MNLLLRGRSTDENFDAEIGYVFLEVTPKLARLILKRAAAFKRAKREDSSALELYYWDHSALYLNHYSLLEEMAALVNNNGGAVETGLSFEEGEPTECDQMIVDEGTVSFTCIPNHCDIHIISDRIPLATIRTALGKKSKKKAKKAA